MRNKKGFTLVEILIVVVILGILAAIVIPQFSDASTQSKLSSCQTTLQSLRSQIELYKIQHNDTPPALATFEDEMTLYSDSSGTTAAAKDAASGIIYGPYVQMVPVNPWNDSATLADADAAGVGWVYDATTGDIYCGISDAPATVANELQDAGAAL